MAEVLKGELRIWVFRSQSDKSVVKAKVLYTIDQTVQQAQNVGSTLN